jgi:hypothetical protein
MSGQCAFGCYTYGIGGFSLHLVESR